MRLCKSLSPAPGFEVVDVNYIISGAHGRIRTSDPLVRSQVFYPTELRVHFFFPSTDRFIRMVPLYIPHI